MRNIDFSSWQSVVVTLVGLALVTLIGVGIRLVVMVTIQQRRERANRQINERLRTLIAAYKVLGGSFTGNLMADPHHLRDLRRVAGGVGDTKGSELASENAGGSDRARRIRDAVEAALSDIILLGTEEQVALAARAAAMLVAGQPVPTHDLVLSLRNFIREALDLDQIPASLAIPAQGPTRPSGASGGKGQRRDGGSGRSGGGMGGGMGMSGGGMGMSGDLDETRGGIRS
ncbi:MAG: hypothetical protein EOP60_03000 [Sphingomonadales bacterium]|nr:MAG: hypothetical protein EOP60_03000 [Sphingomonadales bacterium]